mmetsp:Transcript_106990/g.230409  ORF Transcript_106990/g.230409 Transcript_106990/m.230409 type:complete len:451 (+) Transcript_106990:112-1464(+)
MNTINSQIKTAKVENSGKMIAIEKQLNDIKKESIDISTQIEEQEKIAAENDIKELEPLKLKEIAFLEEKNKELYEIKRSIEVKNMELDPIKSESEKIQAENAKLKDQLESIQQNMEEQKEVMIKIESKNKQAEEEIAKTLKEHENLEKERDELLQMLNEIQTPDKSSLADVEAEISKIKIEVQTQISKNKEINVETVSDKIKLNNNKIEEIKSKQTELETQNNDIENELKLLTGNIEGLKSRIQEKSKNLPDTTDIVEKIKKLQLSNEEIKTQITNSLNEINSINLKLSECENPDATIKKLTIQRDELMKVQKENEELLKDIQKSTGSTLSGSGSGEAAKEKGRLQEELANAEANIKVLEDSKDELKQRKSKIEAKWDILAQELAEREKLLASLSGHSSNQEDRLDAINQMLKEKRMELNKLSQSYDIEATKNSLSKGSIELDIYNNEHK